jgi:hypothetical protein
MVSVHGARVGSSTVAPRFSSTSLVDMLKVHRLYRRIVEVLRRWLKNEGSVCRQARSTERELGRKRTR